MANKLINKQKTKSQLRVDAIVSYKSVQHAAKKLQQGMALHNVGQLEQARFIYEEILIINPGHFDALQLSGFIAAQTKQWDKALLLFDEALRINTNNASLYNNRGNVLQELKRWEEALASYDNAITLKHDYAEAYSNRGNVLQELKLLEKALASYDMALEFKRDLAEAYYNQGNVLQELKRWKEALASYDNAITLKHDYAEAYMNKSLATLLDGNFVNGFNLYEWRHKTENFKNKNGERIFKQPLWLGKESLVNKKILLYNEQGLGDALQFCRYANLVAELGAKVVLEVPQPLVNLLQNLAGVHQLVAAGTALPDFDYQCPLMSLPLAFKTAIDTIPNQIPYIYSSIDKQDKWRQHIGRVGFKIAICWQGNPKSKVDVGRSFPVSLFEDIAKIDGVRLISLQKNAGAEQLKNLPDGMKIESLPYDFDSGENAFLDSAAVMKCVDLVITSDTALTHLAGALGVKAWLPLKCVPDWRWMLDRGDSPWYSNHRLFRQTTRDDWTGVFKEMEAELAKLLFIK